MPRLMPRWEEETLTEKVEKNAEIFVLAFNRLRILLDQMRDSMKFKHGDLHQENVLFKLNSNKSKCIYPVLIDLATATFYNNTSSCVDMKRWTETFFSEEFIYRYLSKIKFFDVKMTELIKAAKDLKKNKIDLFIKELYELDEDWRKNSREAFKEFKELGLTVENLKNMRSNEKTKNLYRFKDLMICNMEERHTLSN